MSKEYIRDALSGLEYVPLELSDTFSFDCVRCANCCRNVEAAIPLESLDVFRIAKHTKKPIDQIIENYTDMWLLAPNYPQLFMKTPEDYNGCIFQKSDLCAIQEAKPRTCRLYPLSAGPTDSGELEYIWVAKQHHQYRPGTLKVSDWMADNLSQEDKDFLLMDYEFTRDISRFLLRIPKQSSEDILRLMLIFRYFHYDTGEDFLKQYRQNMKLLLAKLKQIAGGERVV